jgi:hypothetical protein
MASLDSIWKNTQNTTKSLGASKNLHIDSDTQVHMTTVYTRNGVGRKENAFRTFSFVIKGLLISSALVGAIIGGSSSAFASANANPVPSTSIDYVMDVNSYLREEASLISNLKMATKVLQIAIDKGQLDSFVYEKVMKSLVSIDTKYAMGEDFKSVDALTPVLNSTDKALNQEVNIPSNVAETRDKSISVLESIQAHLGDQSEAKVSGQVKIASVQAEYKQVNVVIDGKLQIFDQSAVLKDGNTLVPLRGVFEALKAEVLWDDATNTVTATKGDITITLTIGDSTAHVNGKAIELSVKAQIINGSTMVPLRFVAEGLGAEVDWLPDTYTATIKSPIAGGVVTPTPISESGSHVVNGIKVKYGKHTYVSKNQSEYDKVIEIANEALKQYDTTIFGGKYHDQFLKYLDGQTKDDYTKGTTDYTGMVGAANSLNSLVRAGVPSDVIQKASITAHIAQALIKGIEDPLTGAPKSAYDALVSRTSDCDSDAQVYSLVFDIMGFNTLIAAGDNHADPLVQLDGTWYKVFGGSFVAIDMAKGLSDGGYIMSQPTIGAEIR